MFNKVQKKESNIKDKKKDKVNKNNNKYTNPKKFYSKTPYH